jgi:CoA:oxalate CoA-transferase
MSEPDGPLAGLLVVDLTRVLAGPYATMLLADLGARVVKVERPVYGDDSRAFGPFAAGESLYYQHVNRGKESIALDLGADEDRDVLFGLVGAADVLVENFRPGVMDRLGLGWVALSARNPRLVYASVSGFGQTGPLRERPAYDAVVQSISGIMSITGFADGPPTKPGPPLADLAGGLFTFGAITSALLGRSISGRGCQIDVAMFDAALCLLENPALAVLAGHPEPVRIGNAHAAIAPFDTFACADGNVVICAANDALFAALCATIGRPELLAAPTYRDNAARNSSRDLLRADLEIALRTRPAADWLARLGAAGIPCAPIAGVAEALASDQTAVRNMVISAGDYRLLGMPMKFSAYPDPATRPAAPALDADGTRIRAEFGPR